MMKIQLNGDLKEFSRTMNLQQLLESLAINPYTVVIERNETVVRRTDLEKTSVEEGDKIEIVRIMGGGSDQPTEETATPPETEEANTAKKATPKKAKRKAPARKGPKNLVIVESPAKARTINKYLGPEYQVEASMGHVRDLPKSKMGIDFEKDFMPQYIVVSKSRKTVTHLKKQAKGKIEIFLAPDPDREGEAITWHLAHIFHEADNEVSIQRVTFNEITKDAVQEAFRHPRAINMNLVNAQQARRILDRIMGYELSPLLWKKVGRGLSAGRVQSVALRLIVEREKEIRSFVPQEYWTLEAKLNSEASPEHFIAKFEKIDNERIELKNKEQTEKIRDEILKQDFKVDKVEQHERRRRPHAPYTTSKLQQEAYNRLGFPSAKTMRIAQHLYEGVELGEEGSVGLITYMRTDSVTIAKSAQEEIANFIQEKFGKKYLPEKPPVYKSKKRAQEAHEAIRATSVRREPGSIQQYLEDDEYKLYDLIWRKTVASQMTPAVDEHITVSILAGPRYLFKTTGRRNLFPGFGILYEGLPLGKKRDESEKEEEKEEAQELPKLTAGEVLKLHELIGYQHFTKPLGRFNDASLVKILEEKGIGRPSTYAPTLYTLLSREYVDRKGGALLPTELGEMVIDLLVEHFPKMMEVEFTATMEDELDKVEEGSMDWVRVVRNFYEPFSHLVTAAKDKMKDYRREAVPTEYVCDICSKSLVIKWGRFGKFLACSGFPDCKYTRSIPTGFVCPLPGCGGDVVKRKSAKRRTFYGCSKYPKCTYITNKLEKPGGGGEAINEDDKINEADRETIGP